MDANFSEFRRAQPREQVPPRNLIEILGRSFTLYLRQFIAYFLLSALAIIPLALFSQLFLARSLTQLESQMNALGINQSLINNLNQSDPQSVKAFQDKLQAILQSNPQVSGALVNSLIAFLLVLVTLSLIGALVRGVLVNSTLTFMAAEGGLERNVSPGRSFGEASNRWMALTLSWIWYFVLIVLMLILPILVVGLVYLISPSLAGCLGLIAVLALLVLVVIVGYMSLTINVFLTPVATLEAVGPFAAVGRAWRLGKAHFWTLIGFQIVVGLLGLLITLIVGSITNNLNNPTAITLVTAIGTTLVAPISVIGSALLYIDARVRYDSLNEELTVLDRPDAALSELRGRPAEGSLFGGSDVVNLIVLGVLFVALSILLSALGSSASGLLRNLPASGTSGLILPFHMMGL